ncbi:hypothetical protein B0H10DRAFT_2000157 [Mycena sp. CBHHK59/15]|nr:hypothetical protein B0H10DRAFT_2000157 [Mycena sp. CBHHK59/15]
MLIYSLLLCVTLGVVVMSFVRKAKPVRIIRCPTRHPSVILLGDAHLFIHILESSSPVSTCNYNLHPTEYPKLYSVQPTTVVGNPVLSGSDRNTPKALISIRFHN